MVEICFLFICAHLHSLPIYNSNLYMVCVDGIFNIQHKMVYFLLGTLQFSIGEPQLTEDKEDCPTGDIVQLHQYGTTWR